jgi:hypothetical protein
MRHVRNTLLFVAILFVIDQAIGISLEKIYFRTATGEGGGLINHALQQRPDILLLGSSRMKHHANSAILQEELGASVYNAGVNGHDFLYAMMLSDLRDRAGIHPQVVVLHVDRRSFAYDESELAKAKVFSYYIDRSPLVREVLMANGPFERIKYLSRSYRANGKVFPILFNVLHSRSSDIAGFEPLKGRMATALADVTPAAAPWDFKLEIFNKFIARCRADHTKVFLVNSPRFPADPREKFEYNKWNEQLAIFLENYPDVTLIEINSYTHPEIFERAELYKDSSHLNAEGADVFTRLLAAQLKSRLNAAHSSSIGAN